MNPRLNLRRARKAGPKDAKSAVEDARKSVEDAAAVSGALWLSYLFTLFYIGLAAGGVTHKDLLLENPVRLPFLGVDLPLVWFFALSPILFVIVHVYALTHFVMLAGKIGAFDEAVGPDGEAIRRRLPSNIFAQFLAGPDDIRKGALGWVLRLIAWFSLVIAPVLLLLFLQAQFLPYHDERIIWVQRFAVLADVILIWMLWPATLRGESEIAIVPGARRLDVLCGFCLGLGPALLLFLLQTAVWLQYPEAIRWLVLLDLMALLALWPTVARYRRALLWRSLGGHSFLTGFGCVAVAFAFFIATFPGGFLGDFNRDFRWIPPGLVPASLREVDRNWKPLGSSVHHLLFAGKIDDISRRPRSPFYTSLVLIGFDALDVSKIDNDDKLKWTKYTLNLRGRNLRGARFDLADLRKSDMSGADLEGATFFKTKMQEAILESAQLRNASFVLTQLHGASLDKAHLEGTYINRTKLFGSSFINSNLEGAILKSVNLNGAWLVDTHLEGSTIIYSDLTSSLLLQTHLDGLHLYNIYTT